MSSFKEFVSSNKETGVIMNIDKLTFPMQIPELQILLYHNLALRLSVQHCWIRHTGTVANTLCGRSRRIVRRMDSIEVDKYSPCLAGRPQVIRLQDGLASNLQRTIGSRSTAYLDGSTDSKLSD